MFKKTIPYVDFNGDEQKEDFYFNLTESEILQKELTTYGSFIEVVKDIVKTKDKPRLANLFQSIILASYGKKSDDGKRFIKSPELASEFKCHAAFDKLYMELLLDAKQAAEFINNVVPERLRLSKEDIEAISKEDIDKTVSNLEEKIETSKESNK